MIDGNEKNVRLNEKKKKGENILDSEKLNNFVSIQLNIITVYSLNSITIITMLNKITVDGHTHTIPFLRPKGTTPVC